ncbi:unnamed protein product [Rotaria socialis]
MHSNLGLAYLRCCDYTLAMENFEKALQIQSVSLPADHLDIATTYNNIDTLRCLPSKADSDIALTYNNIENHFDFPIAYSSIGLIHAANGSYTGALINYNKAFSTSASDHPFSSRRYLNIDDVYRTTDNKPLNSNEHSTAYENIADLLFLNDDFKAALEYYKKKSNCSSRENYYTIFGNNRKNAEDDSCNIDQIDFAF